MATIPGVGGGEELLATMKKLLEGSQKPSEIGGLNQRSNRKAKFDEG